MEILNTDVNKPVTGLSSDSAPEATPKGMYPFALNTVNKGDDLATEKGNTPCGNFPNNYIPVGNRYINDGRNIVFLVSLNELYSEIGIVDNNCNYTTVVNSRELGFKLSNQIDIRYRLRRGCEDVVYFTDNNKPVGYFNFSKPENFYTQNYKDFLASDSQVSYTGEKWDVQKFGLFPAYTVPCISDMEVINGGQLKSGSYNFAIQYLDDNLNPTNFVYSSQLVPIYEASLTGSFTDIIGSSNLETDELAGSAPTNKSIKLYLTGLDTHYKFYKVAIIEATSKTGKITRTILSPAISINRTEFTYDGNIQGYTEMPVQDISVPKADISIARHIEQIENRLILSKTKGKQVQYCDFQKFASKINTTYIVRESAATDVNDPGSPKSPNTMWERQGHMGGEVYARGIVYVFNDGLETPAFHIPGRSPGKYKNHLTGQIIDTDDQQIIAAWNKDVSFINDNEIAYNALPANQKAKKYQVYDTSVKYSGAGVTNSFGAMSYHGNRDVFYEPRADCSENDYWGVDACGLPLVGKPIRHHRFPTRFKEPHIRPGGVFNGSTGLYLDVNLIDGKEFPVGPVNITISYEVDGVPGSRTIAYDSADDLPVSKFLVIGSEADFESIIVISSAGTIVDATDLFTYRIYKEEITSDFIDTGVVRNLGLQFSDIQYPHPDIVGHYFVRGERDEQNRTILDKGFAGRLRAKNVNGQNYTSFSYFNADQDNLTDDNYLFTPRIQFNKESLNGDYLKYEGDFNDENTYVASREEDGAGSKFKEINNVIEYRTKSFGGFDTIRGNQNFDISDSVTLGALAKDLKYNGVDSPLYNMSWTNRVKVVSTKELFPLTQRTKIAYVSYMVNRNVHPILDDIKYQRTHNCLLTPANTNRVFGGDIFISRWDIANSLYRKKKKGIIKDLLNIVLIAAAVVATVATAGLTAPAIAAVIAGASAAGIASAIAVTAIVAGAIGVTAQAIQTITDEIEDGGLDQMTDDSEFNRASGTGVRLSSYIAYANELLSGMYVESEVNVSLAQEENHACGAKFRYQTGVYEYFRSRWLYFDQDTEKWTPKGIACPETYNYNKDFSRQNQESIYFALPATYDCCSDCKESHPNRIHWSEPAFQEELSDNYRVFKPNNYRDIEAEHGDITNIIKRNNNLFIQTSEALWKLPQSNQERVTNELVTFIGTGDFFSLNPLKIIDAEIGTAGTQHKWATINTVVGLLFVNEIEGKVYLFDDRFSILSDKQESIWFKSNLTNFFGKQFRGLTGRDFPNIDNNANPFGTGIHSTYDGDPDNKRIIITKRDYLLLPEFESEFILISSVGNQMPIGLSQGQLVFDMTTSKFVVSGGAPGQYEFVDFNNSKYFESKSWTKSFSLNKQTWTSYHSYIPNYYIYTHNDLFSFIASSSLIWKHNIEGIYSNFYGVQYPHIIEQVFVGDRITTMYWEDICIQTLANRYDTASGEMIEERFVTFNKMVAYNNRQSTGELIIKTKSSFDDMDYMEGQVTDELGVVIAEKVEKDWSINDIKDYVNDPARALFLRSWKDIRQNHFIDKVVNQTNINYSKDWTEVESLRDKYLIVRLKFDNFTNIQLVTKFLLDTKAISFK